jgi:hypothetical protein
MGTALFALVTGCSQLKRANGSRLRLGTDDARHTCSSIVMGAKPMYPPDPGTPKSSTLLCTHHVQVRPQIFTRCAAPMCHHHNQVNVSCTSLYYLPPCITALMRVMTTNTQCLRTSRGPGPCRRSATGRVEPLAPNRSARDRPEAARPNRLPAAPRGIGKFRHTVRKPVPSSWLQAGVRFAALRLMTECDSRNVIGSTANIIPNPSNEKTTHRVTHGQRGPCFGKRGAGRAHPLPGSIHALAVGPGHAELKDGPRAAMMHGEPGDGIAACGCS